LVGTPLKAGNTLIWVFWVFLLMSASGLMVFLLFLGARTVVR
jgi:hypothetical protein